MIISFLTTIWLKTMRFIKLLTVLALVILLAWVIVGEQLSGVSSDATVNAELATLTAPISGNLEMSPSRLGAAVPKGKMLANIMSYQSTTETLENLRLNYTILEAQALGVSEKLSHLGKLRASLISRRDAYKFERVAEFETRLKYAEARLLLLQNGESEDTISQIEAQDGLTDNPGDPLLSGIALEYARERVAAFNISLRGARRGVFLGDGYNDAPWSEQELARLEASIAQANSMVGELKLSMTALKVRIGVEQVRAIRQASANLTSPVNGKVWDRNARSGEYIERGTVIVRLIDCDSVIVTASVTEETYNRLRIGDAATFRLSGESKVLSANVIRLGGAGAAKLYLNLAVAPSKSHLEKFDVALVVPALRDAPDLRCLIGQTGRVFFEVRPLDWLRRMVY